MRNTNLDPNMVSYQICVENFNQFALAQDPKDRLGYRDAAMEAITDPSTGMVIEKLYSSMVARSGVNFGKIPDSLGDLTSFTKYKAITETFAILDKQLSQLKIPELTLTHELHDNLIRLRDDFAYGFRSDSQFLKTTYNSMVYALCEMLNLCTVIYVDNLKAAAEGKQFKYQSYDKLLLVQNVKKFNAMVKSGEWAEMMKTTRNGTRNLSGSDVVDGANSVMGNIASILGAGGALAFAYDKLKKSDGSNLGEKLTGAVKTGAGMARHPVNSAKTFVGKGKSLPAKALRILLIVAAILMTIRAMIHLFWRATYALHDVLDDNAKLLAANMQCSQDNTATSLQRQQKMYELLAGTRDRIETALLNDDKRGRKELEDSNRHEMTRDTIAIMPETPDAGYVIFG